MPSGNGAEKHQQQQTNKTKRKRKQEVQLLNYAGLGRTTHQANHSVVWFWRISIYNGVRSPLYHVTSFIEKTNPNIHYSSSLCTKQTFSCEKPVKTQLEESLVHFFGSFDVRL